MANTLAIIGAFTFLAGALSLARMREDRWPVSAILCLLVGLGLMLWFGTGSKLAPGAILVSATPAS